MTNSNRWLTVVTVVKKRISRSLSLTKPTDSPPLSYPSQYIDEESEAVFESIDIDRHLENELLEGEFENWFWGFY